MQGGDYRNVDRHNFYCSLHSMLLGQDGGLIGLTYNIISCSTIADLQAPASGPARSLCVLHQR